MSLRKNNKIKIFLRIVIFILITSLSIYYYKQIPCQNLIHWTLIVPWVLSLILFILLKLLKKEVPEKTTTRQYNSNVKKIKRFLF